MELLYILMAVAFLAGPWVLSIVALVLAVKARRGEAALRLRVEAPTPAARPAPVPAASPAVPERPPPLPPGAAAPAPTAGKPRRPAHSLEQAIGGRVASFVGIGVLVTGIVLLVAYAIQNRWLGPRARVALGLAVGAVLVALGRLAERRGPRLRILARALTGGGGALFYFCVFAAHRLYALIGVAGAAVGLTASAAAVLGLAWVYGSQSVALVGVLGAFLAPVLAGSDMERGFFPLAYVLVVNLPVVFLGLRRDWQALYNTAFLFTAAYAVFQLEWLASAPAWQGLLFACAAFAEFAALGLVKLRGERSPVACGTDIVRLGLNSLLLLGLLYWVLERRGLEAWQGAGFLLAAAVHVVLVRAGRSRLRSYGREILALLVGALSFAALALPLQLDGAWVSAGWSVEGAILAWYALRIGSAPLQAGALFLGLLGLGKTMLFDVSLYDTAPALFLNARFGAGLVSAGLLGVQAWLCRRAAPAAGGAPRRALREAVLAWCAVAGLLAVLYADAFWTLGAAEPLPWMLTSAFLLAVAAAVARGARGFAPFRVMGCVLSGLLAFKLILVDLPACYGGDALDGWVLFRNGFIAVHVLLLAGLLVLAARFDRWAGRPGAMPAALATTLHIAGISGLVALFSAEAYRAGRVWSEPAVTVWWAAVGLGLVLLGLARRGRAHRYLGLTLIGLATVKVLLVDLAELRGLPRVGAFVGVGLLLLLLSFAYQRLASHFAGEPRP